MAGTISILEGCNIFVGDNGTDNSKHLLIQDVTIPNMEEMSAKHHAGGSYGEIDFGGMGFNALEVKFKLTGYDPQAVSQWGINGRLALPYTIYGAFRERTTSVRKPFKAIAKGRMTGAQSDSMKRGDLFAQEFTIKEILHYELYFDGAEINYFDWAGTIWRVGGADQNADLRAMLAIP